MASTGATSSSRIRKLALVAALAALAACPAPAAAHPFLIQSAPAPDAVVPQAPRAIALSFTESVDPGAASVHVAGPNRARVTVGHPSLAGPTTLTAKLAQPPPAGVYHVTWAARGSDGHTVSGSFAFGVPGAHGALPPGVRQLGAAGFQGAQVTANDSAIDVIARWLGIVAAGVLLAGTILRRRAAADEARWRRLRFAAIAVAALATAQALAAASGGGWHELGAEPRGQYALVRIAVLLALAFVVALRERADAVIAAGAAAALVTYALEGHAQTVTHAPALAYAEQIAHVGAAGLWAGGLVVLATGTVRGRDGVRAFAVLAAAAVAVLAVAGALLALREVRAWYFLFWSTYGRLVIAKSIVLLVLLVLAGLTVRALRRRRPEGLALRAEAVGALAVVLLASLLAGVAPGRGQLLPAQRGNLLGGASFATVATGSQAAKLTLAPAQAGFNALAVVPTSLDGTRVAAAITSVRATLTCDCRERAKTLTLVRGAGGAWWAPVDLPARGTWLANVSVDGRSAIAPAPLAVGDPRVRGISPATAVMTADLSGRDALRCRAEAEGAVLAAGRLDARGGLPGGRKLVVDVLDDRGDPAFAASLVRRSREGHAIALVSPCGRGAAAAVRAGQGLPTIVSDPAVPPVAGKHVWRTAGDPNVEGAAIGQFLTKQPKPRGLRPPRVVAVVDGGAPQAAASQRIAGLTRALAGAGVSVRRLPASGLTRPARLRAAIAPRRYMATVFDGDPGVVGPALGAIGNNAGAATLNPDEIVATSPMLDERFQLAAGVFGRTGEISSPAEVLPNSADAQIYETQVQTFFRGERPSIPGLRGYVAGLALDEGVHDGTGAGEIAGRLRRPRPFTDALLAPWLARAPEAGAPLFDFLAPSFLSSNLLPAGSGGEPHSGAWFNGGAWTTTSTQPYGLTSLLR